MKKIILSALALLGMGTMANAQFSVYDQDGKVLFTMPTTPAYVDFTYHKPTAGTENGHDWVDLGLSVKWATMNVGATAPQEYGSYIAWGETEAKEKYDWSTYKIQADFIGDNKTTLEKADDAAAANWGGDWVMPSEADWEEIYKNCTYEWITQNGVNGYKITGSNSNSIFLPAAGCRYDGSLDDEGSYGYYCSSSLYKYYSYYCRYLDFGSGYFRPWGNGYRFFGLSVRPVCPSEGNTNGHVAVDLGLPSGKLWAECNVGATAPQEYGDYIAWGETEAKSDYSWSTYKHMQEGKSDLNFINKYQAPDSQYDCIWYRFEKYSYDDNKITLEKADDAATANWGDNWRMPTVAEWEELCNNTTQTWTDDYEGTGVKGNIFTSKKKGYEGISIFLPAAGGYRNYGTLDDVGSNGYYWSSYLGYGGIITSYLLSFSESNFRPSMSDYRVHGYTVRPVCQK